MGRQTARRGEQRGYFSQGFKGPKEVCDVCGLTFYREKEMRMQDGLWKCVVGPHCYDIKDDEDD